jgi:nitroreductase
MQASNNTWLQGGYFILAARALGLDCGPMSGFNPAKVNELFFEGSSWRASFLLSLGYGSGENIRERAPRPSFDEACRIV